MKQLRAAIVLTLFFILVTGLAFPYFVTFVSQKALPLQANGSMIEANGKGVGRSLFGRGFASPKYLHPRPSAAGNGYDANNSSGTNLGPTNPKLLEGDKHCDGVKTLAEKYRKENSLSESDTIPVDAVTRSGSGLDPHISPRNAELQAGRIAKERGMSKESVLAIIHDNTETPFVGIFGDARVNVLKVNLALDGIRI